MAAGRLYGCRAEAVRHKLTHVRLFLTAFANDQDLQKQEMLFLKILFSIHLFVSDELDVFEPTHSRINVLEEPLIQLLS